MVELGETITLPKPKQKPLERYTPKHLRPRDKDIHASPQTINSWISTWLGAEIYYPVSPNAVEIVLGNAVIDAIMENRATWNDYMTMRLGEKDLAKARDKALRAHAKSNTMADPDTFLIEVQWRSFQLDIQKNCLAFLRWAKAQGLYHGGTESTDLDNFFSRVRNRRAASILQRLYKAAARGAHSDQAKHDARERRDSIPRRRKDLEISFEGEIAKALDEEAGLIKEEEGYLIPDSLRKGFIKRPTTNVDNAEMIR